LKNTVCNTQLQLANTAANMAIHSRINTAGYTTRSLWFH
jgi:hypothetical protein